MPKQKTHKGAAKRYKVSAKGKVIHKKAGKSHLCSCKTGNRIRKLRRPGISPECDAARIRKALCQE